MKILTELITDKTKIMDLNEEEIFNYKKGNIIDITSSKLEYYCSKMYYKNGIWYYAKKDLDYKKYPYTIPEELMGTYLSNELNLKTIKYEIARINEEYVIVSKNFKNKKNTYYTFNDLVDIDINDNIDILKIFTSKENYEVLLDQILKLLALDTYMLQQDRCNVNLQFVQNNQTKEILLAPIYDYANTLIAPIDAYLTKNILKKITKQNIIELIKKYPKYQEYLNILLDKNMKQIWEKICIDYKLNMNCYTYDMVSNYYELKDENQKKYMKQLIKDIHL